MRHLLALLIALLSSALPGHAQQQQPADAGREALRMVESHRRWAARHVDTTFTDKADLLRAAADAATTASHEPAYIAILRKGARHVPALRPLADLRASGRLDTANRCLRAALQALADTARHLTPRRDDVVARACYQLATATLYIDTAATLGAIDEACTLQQRVTEADTSATACETLLLYRSNRLYFLFALTEGDTPLHFIELAAIENEAAALSHIPPDSYDRACLYNLIAFLKSSTAFVNEAETSFQLLLTPDVPHPLDGFNRTTASDNSSAYFKQAAAIASRVLGESHPDALVLRLNWINALWQQHPSDSLRRLASALNAFAQEYFPAGSLATIDPLLFLILSGNLSGDADCQEAATRRYLKTYDDFYGRGSAICAQSRSTLMFQAILHNYTSGHAEENRPLVEAFEQELRTRYGRHSADYALNMTSLLHACKYFDAALYNEHAARLLRELSGGRTPPDWTKHLAMRWLANALLADGHYADASRLFVQMLSELPRDHGVTVRLTESETALNAAICLMQAGDTTAGPYFRRAIRARREAGWPSFKPVRHYLGFLTSNGQTEEALAQCDTLLAAEPGRLAPEETAYLQIWKAQALAARDDRLTTEASQLIEMAIPVLMAHEATLSIEATEAFVYAHDYYYRTGVPVKAEEMARRGLACCERLHVGYSDLQHNFVTRLAARLIEKGDDVSAETLLNGQIAQIEARHAQNSTAYLDLLMMRNGILMQRSSADGIKNFYLQAQLIEPFRQVYERSGRSDYIRYHYLLPLLSQFTIEGSGLLFAESAGLSASAESRASAFDPDDVRKRLKATVAELRDMERGLPEYSGSFDHRKHTYYSDLCMALGYYAYVVDNDTKTMERYMLLATESNLLRGDTLSANWQRALCYLMLDDDANAVSYLTKCYMELDRYDINSRMNIVKGLYACFVSHDLPTITLRYAKQMGSLMRNYIRRYFDFISSDERDQFVLLHKSTGYYLNSQLLRIPDETAGPAYDAALFDKGLLLRSWERVRRSILRSGNAGLIAQLDTLSALNASLRRMAADPTNRTSVSERVAVQLKIQAVEKRLARETAQFRTDTMRTATWQQVQAALQPGDAAIEFVATDTVLAALVVRPGMERPAVVALDGANRVAALLADAGRLPADTRARRLYTHGRSPLYDLVWRPIEPLLRGTRRVYYSPTGVLHRVAFAALPVSPDSCLTDRHELHLVSTTAEVLRPRHDSPVRTATLFGGIHYSPGQGAADATPGGAGERAAMEEEFPYLEETRRETDTIAHDLAQAGVSLHRRSGDNATESAFYRLDGASTDIIHLATHGFYIDARDAGANAFLRNHPGALASSMQRTGLAFAGANATWEGAERPDSTDGILTAAELSLLDLSGTDLVVLSACETALGDYNTEGVWGLQRGFKEAGARSLLLSLWNVNDAATATLMQGFYRRWLGGTPKGEAFRQAVDALRRTHPNPFIWAAFVMLDAGD